MRFPASALIIVWTNIAPVFLGTQSFKDITLSAGNVTLQFQLSLQEEQFLLKDSFSLLHILYIWDYIVKSLLILNYYLSQQ